MNTFFFQIYNEQNVKIIIHKTITFPVFLHGRETWFLILRDEYRPRVFKNRILRKVFRLKKDEVTGV
jgi:hypothetical protein